MPSPISDQRSIRHKSPSRSGASMLLPIPLLLFVCSSLWTTVHAQDTCQIDSVTYNRGDQVDKPTLCGRPDLYPCFCNPDLAETQGSLDCPVCSIAANGSQLRCFTDGQSISFFDANNQGTTCTCDASTPGQPVEICTPDPLAGVCQESDPDNGQIITLQPGQAYQFLGDSRCGSIEEYPCFCDPGFPGKIVCPYCAVPTEGGTLTCLRDQQTERFVPEGETEQQDCTCNVPDPFNVPVHTCITAPTPAPVFVTRQCQIATPGGSTVELQEGSSLGTLFDNGCGSAFPCFCNPDLPEQVECPYCAFAQSDGSASCAVDNEVFSYTTSDTSGQKTLQCRCIVTGEGTANVGTFVDCDDGFEPPPIGSCLSRLQSGEIVVTANGESYGDLVVGPCGSPQDFPTFCNKAVLSEKEYPYCQFETEGGDTVCAKDGETISFVDESGNTQACECRYRSVSIGPQPQCRVTAVATDQPVAEPTDAPEPIPTPAPATPADRQVRGSARASFGRSVFDILAVVSLLVLVVSS